MLTLPDSISWLLNLRGSDIPRNPVVQSFAIIDDTGAVQLFADVGKFGPDVRAHLGNAVTLSPPESFATALGALADAPRFRLVETRALGGDVLHRWVRDLM